MSTNKKPTDDLASPGSGGSGGPQIKSVSDIQNILANGGEVDSHVRKPTVQPYSPSPLYKEMVKAMSPGIASFDFEKMPLPQKSKLTEIDRPLTTDPKFFRELNGSKFDVEWPPKESPPVGGGAVKKTGAKTKPITKAKTTLEKKEKKDAVKVFKEVLIEKETSPKETSPRATSPKETSPRATSPRATSPKATSPKKTSPKETSPKETSPKTSPRPSKLSPRLPVAVKTNSPRKTPSPRLDVAKEILPAVLLQPQEITVESLDSPKVEVETNEQVDSGSVSPVAEIASVDGTCDEFSDIMSSDFLPLSEESSDVDVEPSPRIEDLMEEAKALTPRSMRKEITCLMKASAKKCTRIPRLESPRCANAHSHSPRERGSHGASPRKAHSRHASPRTASQMQMSDTSSSSRSGSSRSSSSRRNVPLHARGPSHGRGDFCAPKKRAHPKLPTIREEDDEIAADNAVPKNEENANENKLHFEPGLVQILFGKLLSILKIFYAIINFVKNYRMDIILIGYFNTLGAVSVLYPEIWDTFADFDIKHASWMGVQEATPALERFVASDLFKGFLILQFVLLMLVILAYRHFHFQWHHVRLFHCAVGCLCVVAIASNQAIASTPYAIYAMIGVSSLPAILEFIITWKTKVYEFFFGRWTA